MDKAITIKIHKIDEGVISPTTVGDIMRQLHECEELTLEDLLIIKVACEECIRAELYVK